MRVALTENNCTVIREPGDKKIYNESQLLHHVKLELIKQGYDVIKKLMWKDGHMVSDTCHYIRSMNGNIIIWDSQYAIRNAATDYNEGCVIYEANNDNN